MTIVPNIPDAVLDQHMALMAKTGGGKSYTTRRIVEGLLDAGRRVCVIDYTGVWYGLRSSADGKKSGYPVVIFGGEHGDVPLNEHAGATLARLVAEGNRPCIVDLDGMTVGQQQRFATAFFEELYRLNSRPLHLVIEEIDEFAPQSGAPGTERLMSSVARIFQRGRRKGFRAIAITQRPANLHKRVLTQCNAMIALRLVAPQDTKALGEWVRGHGDDAKGKEVVASLSKLQRGEGWIWAPEQDVLKRVKFPAIKTFDSMRAPVDGEISEPATWADVDLDAVRDAMAGAIDEAEANDPKRLKAEIKRLQGELAKAGDGVSPAAIDEAKAAGFREGIAAAKDAVTEFETGELIKAIGDLVGAARDEIVGRIDRSAKPKGIPIRASARAMSPSGSSGQVRVIPSGPRHPPPSRPAPPIALSGSRQRILDALAWLEGIGVRPADKTVVAFLADASPSSSTYGNNLGALRSAGLIDYPRPGDVQLTADGGLWANPPPKPASLADLHEAVADKLNASQNRILSALIEAWPSPIIKDTLAEMVEASATSSTYGNNLGRLRSLGLIDYPKPGQVVATELLFPEGLE